VVLFDCPIDNLSLDETVGRVVALIRHQTPHQHVVVNVHKIVLMHRDPVIREIIRGCALINVDGQPLVFLSRLLGRPLRARVTGIDLMEALVARAAVEGFSVFFLGARKAVVDAVVARYQGRYPTLRVAGSRDGYWGRGEEEGVAALVAEARPDILLVAISSPKKELFLARHQSRMRVPFAMGVGGAFDVVAGLARRAPPWVQALGFEWLYRTLQEPGRLAGRYARDALGFLPIFLRETRRCITDLRGRPTAGPGGAT
jgi:N-acetylglucosaminyldiphosphoundecaprenol N-acetyl-beta-D-mannosaminyltransferase